MKTLSCNLFPVEQDLLCLEILVNFILRFYSYWNNFGHTHFISASNWDYDRHFSNNGTQCNPEPLEGKSQAFYKRSAYALNS